MRNDERQDDEENKAAKMVEEQKELDERGVHQDMMQKFTEWGGDMYFNLEKAIKDDHDKYNEDEAGPVNKHSRGGPKINLRDENQEDSGDDGDSENALTDGEYEDKDPKAKIDLWKKLQDLMQNQISEVHKTLRKEEKNQALMQKKFFKIALPMDELDKFGPKNGKQGYHDFGVHLVLSQRQQVEESKQAKK